MSDHFKQIVATLGMEFMPIIALVLFFVVMSGAYLWAFQSNRKEFYNYMGQFALDPDEKSQNPKESNT